MRNGRFPWCVGIEPGRLFLMLKAHELAVDRGVKYAILAVLVKAQHKDVMLFEK